jgi:hypothetical protein
MLRKTRTLMSHPLSSKNRSAFRPFESAIKSLLAEGVDSTLETALFQAKPYEGVVTVVGLPESSY